MLTRFYIVIIFVLIVVLGVRFFIFYRTLPRYSDGDKAEFSLLLQQEPILANTGQQLLMRAPSGSLLTIHTTSKDIYQYGDTLQVSGIIKIKPTSSGSSSLVMYYPRIKILDDKNFMWEMARSVRNKSRTLYHKVLPPISASLLMGIVFGVKVQYPKEFLQALRSVGVLHVIAASGMNVSFIAGALLFSLGSLIRRRFALFMTILGVIFYTFITGFQPSILRASIMAIIAFTASIFGRQNTALFSIGLTGLFMIFLQPSLLFDVSFQLSFLSTIGILLVKPLLDSGLGRLGTWGRSGLVTGDITTTMAAQLGTLPVMLGTFGSYGILSILVNALVLWTVPILMTTGSLAVLLGFLYEPAGELFLWASYPFLLFFQVVVSFFGASGLLISVQNIPAEIWVGYYCLLLGIVTFFSIVDKKKLSAH